MTNAVIIILCEILEAMLIVSLLLAASGHLGIRRFWTLVGVIAGLAGAAVFASTFDQITDSFGGIGQEIANATMLYVVCVCMAVFALFISSHAGRARRGFPVAIGIAALIGCIGLAITREGAEIYIYLSGYFFSPQPVAPIVFGSILGTGIGLSVGALIYYGLTSLGERRTLMVVCMLLVPVAAGMVSQGSNYLMQADLLPSQTPLWDSSMLIPEGSIVGELLYALFSYEATPTPLQVYLYLAVAILMIGAMWVTRRGGKQSVHVVRG